MKYKGKKREVRKTGVQKHAHPGFPTAVWNDRDRFVRSDKNEPEKRMSISLHLPSVPLGGHQRAGHVHTTSRHGEEERQMLQS